MYGVQDWAEVHRLHHGERWSKKAIADKLGMSRNTVDRLLGLLEPPRYERQSQASLLDPFKDEIAAMLDGDPRAPSTVILERLRRNGYSGGITILKDHVRGERAKVLTARAFQRTSYLPGEISQIDWWHTGAAIPVGKGARREAFGLVATLPHSAAHATVFTFARTVADFCAALIGCFVRLGGVAEAAVMDNDASIVVPTGRWPRPLHDEVATLFGQLLCKPVVLRPRRPQSKGQGERTVGYLETSFLPLRDFADLDDMQCQHDDWASNVAFRRHHRRVGAVVGDAWRVERTFLRALPSRLPDTDRHLEVRLQRDGFARVADVDYSVPPGLSGRRSQIRLSVTEVVVFLEGTEIARHPRSFVPADVVLDPRHARMLRQAREAKGRLDEAAVKVPGVDLARYDRLAGVHL